MKLLSLSFLLLLSACSSTPSPDAEAEVAAEATDQCLANPDLAKSWGECNVKQTIFSRMEGIGGCQAKHAKSTTPLMLKIWVKPNGKVKDVRAEDGSPKNRGLEKCLATEISRLQFAAPPKGVKPVIYFPYQQ